MKKFLYTTRHTTQLDADGYPKKTRKVAPELPAGADGGNATPVVIFMASSTPEKIRDLRLIAETKHLPLVFEDIHKLLGSFHSVDEDEKDFSANAAKKMEAIDIEKFRKGKHAVRLKEYLKSRNIPANAPVYFGTEDGGFAIEKEVWDAMRKDGISAEILGRIEPKGAFSGPAVETGPVLSASLGSYNTAKRITEAAQQLGREPGDVKVKEFSTITLAPLKKNSSGKNDIYTATCTHRLHTPSDASIAEQLQNGKVSTYHFFKPENDNSGRSIAEMGAAGICEHSVRAKIIDDINESFFGVSQARYDHGFREQDLLGGDQFRIGSFGRDNPSLQQKMHELFDAHGLYADYFMHVPQSAYISDASPRAVDAKPGAYEILANIEEVIKDSDAAVLFPDMQDKKTAGHGADLQELIKLYTLFSLEVNRQLNPRDMEKPVFILNHDGSWDNALAIHHDLTNSGMSKEFNIEVAPTVPLPANVNIRSTSYFDVIGGQSADLPASFEDTKNVLVELLKEKRKGYTRRPTNPDKVKEDGLAPENGPDFKVAIFCSASNENQQLNGAVKQLSYDIVKEDMGVIYGGGDRYTMGAVLDGVRQFRDELRAENDKLGEEYLHYRAWVGGYSTKQILKSETKFGKFADDLSYTKRTTDIYQRMADMLEHSDVVVAAPGGAGTVQEWAAALILNKMHPERAKPLIFFDPPLNEEKTKIWDKSLRILLGEKDYALLTSSDAPAEEKLKRSQELGIYVETTEESVKQRILQLRSEHKARQGHVSLAQRGDEGHSLLH